MVLWRFLRILPISAHFHVNTIIVVVEIKLNIIPKSLKKSDKKPRCYFLSIILIREKHISICNFQHTYTYMRSEYKTFCSEGYSHGMLIFMSIVELNFHLSS